MPISDNKKESIRARAEKLYKKRMADKADAQENQSFLSSAISSSIEGAKTAEINRQKEEREEQRKEDWLKSIGIDRKAAKARKETERLEKENPEVAAAFFKEPKEEKETVKGIAEAINEKTEGRVTNQGEDKKAIYGAGMGIKRSAIPELSIHDKAQKEIEKIKRDVDPAIIKVQEQKAKELQDFRAKLKDVAKEDISRTEWLRLSEQLSQALVQLGAGYYGAKHGVDMSGLKFNKANWEKRIDRIYDRLDKQLAGIDKQEARLDVENRELKQEAKEEASRQEANILRKAAADTRAKERAEDKDLQLRIAHLRSSGKTKSTDAKDRKAVYAAMVKGESLKLKGLTRKLNEEKAAAKNLNKLAPMVEKLGKGELSSTEETELMDKITVALGPDRLKQLNSKIPEDTPIVKKVKLYYNATKDNLDTLRKEEKRQSDVIRNMQSGQPFMYRRDDGKEVRAFIDPVTKEIKAREKE